MFIISHLISSLFSVLIKYFAGEVLSSAVGVPRGPGPGQQSDQNKTSPGTQVFNLYLTQILIVGVVIIQYV